MTSDIDDRLLEELAEVLGRREPIPEEVLWSAKAAFAWSEISNAIAALEYDSALDELESIGVRGGASLSDRVLKFRGLFGTAELYISDAGRRLVGKLEPNVFRSVVLRHPSRSTTIDLDSSGNFFVDRLPRGLLSVKCLPLDESQQALETEWVSI